MQSIAVRVSDSAIYDVVVMANGVDREKKI
jgi:hypothetical protein